MGDILDEAVGPLLSEEVVTALIAGQTVNSVVPVEVVGALPL